MNNGFDISNYPAIVLAVIGIIILTLASLLSYLNSTRHDRRNAEAESRDQYFDYSPRVSSAESPKLDGLREEMHRELHQWDMTAIDEMLDRHEHIRHIRCQQENNTRINSYDDILTSNQDTPEIDL